MYVFNFEMIDYLRISLIFWQTGPIKKFRKIVSAGFIAGYYAIFRVHGDGHILFLGHRILHNELSDVAVRLHSRGVLTARGCVR